VSGWGKVVDKEVGFCCGSARLQILWLPVKCVPCSTSHLLTTPMAITTAEGKIEKSGFRGEKVRSLLWLAWTFSLYGSHRSRAWFLCACKQLLLCADANVYMTLPMVVECGANSIKLYWVLWILNMFLVRAHFWFFDG